MVLTIAPMNITLLIPIIGAILIGLTGRFPNVRETCLLLTSLLLAGSVYFLYHDYLAGYTPYGYWFDFAPSVPFAFSLEPIGIIFALLASSLFIATNIYSIGYMRGNQEHNQTRFYCFITLTIAATIGLAFADNLLTLFICYELITLFTYPLVTHGGTTQDKQAGRTYLALLLTPSILFLLPAILWIYTETGTLDFHPAGILPDDIQPLPLTSLLLIMVYGSAKVALMPLHRWLPAAMVAPTPVSALLHAVAVVKAGAFTVIKLVIYIFGYDNLFEASTVSSVVETLMYLAAITILVSSAIALRQDNLKLRLAYSTISQLSYIVLAAALFSPMAMLAAIFQLVAHGCAKITLFFAAGSIYTASKKTCVSELTGIGRLMPITMGTFIIGAISMVGLPLTGGFIAKWYLFAGSYESHTIIPIIVIILSTLLNIGYFFPIIYRAFLPIESAEGNIEKHAIKEAPYPIIIALILTSMITIGLFIWPDPILELAKYVIRG